MKFTLNPNEIIIFLNIINVYIQILAINLCIKLLVYINANYFYYKGVNN